MAKKKKNQVEFQPKHIVSEMRRSYPKGSRVELLWMDDKEAPPEGTRGTVTWVDDAASIMVKWDTGQTLSVIYDVDQCVRVYDEEKEEAWATEQ